MKPASLFAALCLMLLPPLAQAASTLVVSSPVANGERLRSTIEVLNSATARIHIGTVLDYLLVRDGKLYSITGKTVSDVSAQRGQIRLPSIGEEQVRLIAGLQDTGRSEAVAGLVGEVYQLKYYNLADQPVEVEMVVSDDARVRDGTAFWNAYFQSAPGRNVLQGFLERHGYGILRFGDEYRVEGFGVTPSPERLALPAAPAP